MTRTAAYTNDAMTDDKGNHFVALVEEGLPGYYVTTWTGTLDYCEGVAAAVNDSKGLTADDVASIVISSMRR